MSTNVHIDKIPLDWHLAISAHFFALTNTFNSCANGESANFSILLSEVQAPVLLWRSRTQMCRRTWQTPVRCRWRPAPWWRLALELSDAGYLKKEENGSTVKCPTSVKGQGWRLSLFFFEHSSCWKKNEITYFSGHHGDVVPFGHFPVQGLQCGNGAVHWINVKQPLEISVAINGVPAKAKWGFNRFGGKREKGDCDLIVRKRACAHIHTVCF